MKIIPFNTIKSFGQTATSPSDSPEFNFFLAMKNKFGIKWSGSNMFSTESKNYLGKPAFHFSKTLLGEVKSSQVSQQKPSYKLDIKYICTADEKGLVSEKVAMIFLKSYNTGVEIKKWVSGNIDGFWQDMLREKVANLSLLVLKDTLGVSGNYLELPREYMQRKNNEEMELQPTTIYGKEGYYYHRLTRVKTNAYQASTLEIFVRKTTFGFSVNFMVMYLEADKRSEEKSIVQTKTLGEAVAIIDQQIQLAKQQRKYVTSENILYIPEGVNSENWDFLLHSWKNKEQEVPAQIKQEKSEPSGTPEVSENPSTFRTPVIDFKKLFGQNNQDFEGYFTGEVPDLAGSLVGTSAVDASQIAGMFSGTNEAIQLVNSYTSDALSNVAYIFNFSKGGAYGVYIPALDKAIKTKALKYQLEQKGYEIKDEHGLLTAYPTKEEKSPEEIDQDIQMLWEQLNASGGSALGINMADVLKATDDNAADIMSNIRQQEPDVPPQITSILHDVLGVYHLAAIILHEASHAKGGDESKAGTDEQSFRSWAQNYLNKQYQSKLSGAGLEEYYSPLELGTKVIHALSRNWYKTSQSFMGRLNYSPSSGGHAPQGSDIRGRYQGSWQSEGFSEWARLVQQDQSIPIEQRLNRGNMSKLEKDIDQENDIIEEQLRKQFRNDSKPNIQLITEELLAPDRDESQGYKAMETLLEERRPQPLMTPLKKAAMKKESSGRENCLFGWFNNLDLDDGSTIPGLSDRVMAWDDRDESFAAEEKWIKAQERYNPSYDLKGFYFRWLEPRWKPELFDDMTKDYTNTTPAKRFAAILDPSLTQMLGVLKTIEEEIINDNLKSTRIVISEGLVDIIKKLTSKEGLNIRAYKISGEDDLFSLWIYGTIHGISDDEIDKAEKYFQNVEGANQYKDIADNLLQGKKIVSSAVEKIINETKELCKEYNVDDLFVIGEYARKIFLGEAQPFVGELSFVCESVDNGLKIGSLLSDVLNISTEHITMSDIGMSFSYRGVKLIFSRCSYIPEIGEKMQEKGHNVQSPLLREICNKDFTINMLVYDIREMKVLDPIGIKEDIKNKVVKTLFSPDFIIESNPIIIFRALGLKLSGYEIEENLERAMIENSSLLSSGKLSTERLRFSKEYLRSIGDNVEDLLEEYGLNVKQE